MKLIRLIPNWLLRMMRGRNQAKRNLRMALQDRPNIADSCWIKRND